VAEVLSQKQRHGVKHMSSAKNMRRQLRRRIEKGFLSVAEVLSQKQRHGVKHMSSVNHMRGQLRPTLKNKDRWSKLKWPKVQAKRQRSKAQPQVVTQLEKLTLMMFDRRPGIVWRRESWMAAW